MGESPASEKHSSSLRIDCVGSITPRTRRLRPDQDGAVRPCAFLTAVHDLCAPRCRKHFFSMLHPPPAKALLFASRRRQPISSSRSSGDSRRFSALPRRSPLLLGRFAMTCTAASLSYADECAASVLAFASMVHANFSASHILPAKVFSPHRAAARPSAHRILQSSSRRFPHRRVVHRFRWGGSQ